MSIKDELINYYSKQSKHSNYQVLPSSLKPILNSKEVDTRTRFEAERLEYILSKIDVQDKSVLDIGGNTGFFIFELIDAGAKIAQLYEGNKEHADFVKLAAKALNLTNVDVINGYFLFDGSHREHYDIILLLNVLHHLGDDYGDKNLSMEAVKKSIINQLNSLSQQTDLLIFQLGFNWQGNPANGLFEHGTKREMVDYIKDGIKGCWDIVAIGIAEGVDQNVCYLDLNETNIERNDSLGEFLNRPLFILKSVRE